MIVIVLSVIAFIVFIIFAARSAIRYEKDTTFIRKNEILKLIRYELPPRLEFAYQPFYDTMRNLGNLLGLLVFLYEPTDLSAVLATCFLVFKFLIFMYTVYVVSSGFRTVFIHGVRKTPALCLNRQTFRIFNKDIEWSTIQRVIFYEDEGAYSLAVNYTPNDSKQIMSKAIDFRDLKDSYEVILPAVEKYWRICSDRTDLKITNMKV
ncbi:MAG: hypothetical protein KGO49_12965 [Gammaproteobacteria bacterium]|nr:hypothetical protein [Gammaproteobacteria bacterium]